MNVIWKENKIDKWMWISFIVLMVVITIWSINLSSRNPTQPTDENHPTQDEQIFAP